jgi:hypothetical protein
MMTGEDFESVFRNAISYMQDNFQYADPLCKALKGSIRLIAAEYKVAYSGILKGYMEDKSGALDRHKSAAAFMVAILRKLKSGDLERNPAVSKLIREKIAIQIGLCVLMTMIKREGRQEECGYNQILE